MIFARILTSVLVLFAVSANAEKGLALNGPNAQSKAVRRVFIGKVERVSPVIALMAEGKTRAEAEYNLGRKRHEVLVNLRKEAEIASGLGRPNLALRYLTYEAEIMPPSYYHVVETPGDGVTITEKFVVRSSYNVLASRETAEAKVELTGMDLKVISSEYLPVYESVLNLSAFDLGNDGYTLTMRPGQFLSGDLLSSTQYIDRKKLTSKITIDDKDGYRVIDLNTKETQEFLNISTPGLLKKVLGFCAGLVGG